MRVFSATVTGWVKFGSSFLNSYPSAIIRSNSDFVLIIFSNRGYTASPTFV